MAGAVTLLSHLGGKVIEFIAHDPKADETPGRSLLCSRH
jgi:hypothetical protein